MGLELDNLPEGGINVLVKEIYHKLMMKRLGLAAIRKTGNADAVETAMLEIVNLNEDFEGLIKMQTQYNKFLKSIGETGQDNPKELRDLVSQIRVNVGSIVSQLPKTEQDGL